MFQSFFFLTSFYFFLTYPDSRRKVSIIIREFERARCIHPPNKINIVLAPNKRNNNNKRFIPSPCYEIMMYIGQPKKALNEPKKNNAMQ
mmetsp:Transcript_28595/g.68852  ORF Transcript_28595/g.68852 Transcript_28595/m.68852 type:complete len:89 (+) Transcript_28595:36-302(+)